MTTLLTSTRRRNPLTGDSILVSPIRISRPWSQKLEGEEEALLPDYEESCYLCAGNKRSNGTLNPNYDGVYVFENDFPSLVKSGVGGEFMNDSLFYESEETGLCEVICYSPKHNGNIAHLPQKDVEEIVRTWRTRYEKISEHKNIGHIQIFETRGKEVGNSAPHPHCQIWSQKSIPTIPEKIYTNQEHYFKKYKKKLLLEYIEKECAFKKRIIREIGDFVLLVPFWAEWPYETYILPKKSIESLQQLTEKQIRDLAALLSFTARLYAQFFHRPNMGAPYMMSLFQKPTTHSPYTALQLFFRFIPPLLNPSRLKYQAGYEKSAESQRDSTPEQAAQELREFIF